MATEIKEEVTITLIDGKEIAVRPLKISLLREFMKKFESLAGATSDNDKSLDVFLDCVQIAMQQYAPELADDRAALEDNLDLPTVYKIVEEAAGINLTELAASMS